MHTQILVLGSGPAGCTAALYGAMAGFKTTLLMGILPGGQMIFTHEIENFPGYLSVSGMDLARCFQEQIKAAGVQMIYENGEQVDFSNRPFSVRTGLGTVITADSVIIATGSSARWLNIPGESKLIGHGISVCATCDGFFFKNKSVAVIGGGNTAAYEALFLAQLCEKVYIIHQGSQMTAADYLMKKIYQNPKIILLPFQEAIAFEGDHKLTGLVIQQTQTHEQQHLTVAGAFEAIGQVPNTHLFQGQLDMDPIGYLITNPETLQTSIAGIFACGDVRAAAFHQAIIAAGSGCQAALSAKHFLIQ